MNSVITPEWTSISIVIYCLLFIGAACSGIIERKGLMSVQYSKFRAGEGMNSHLGMFIIYFVPFLAHIPAVFYFAIFPLTTVQTLFAAAILIHFGKRSFESLFIHKYSGPIDANSVFQITAGYTFVAIYSAYLFPDSLRQVDTLVWVGVALFALGQSGNFYHHYLLAKLRESEEGYFIPRGGLFNQITCPHYFFEVMAWIGIALICRHIDMFLLAVMMGSYLTGRSAKARAWYLERFPDYPASRKNILPFIF